MAKPPIEIGIASETKAFRAGVESGIIEPLEDAQKALSDLGKNKGPEQLERDLEKAQQESKDLKKEIDRTADALEDAGRAARRMGAQSEDGFASAAQSSEEFKREAASNFSEVTSSFDGSMSSIQDLAQGTLGGLAASGLPGIGIAAGAAAVAVGLIGAEFEANREKEEAAAERAATWADSYIEAGSRIIGSAQIVAGVQAIATDPEQYKVATENAKNWGVDVSSAMRAMAGDATALSVVQSTLAERTAEADRLLAEQEVQVTSAAGAAYDLADSVTAGKQAFADLNAGMDAGAIIAGNVSEALLGLVDGAGKVVEEVDALGNKLYTLPGGQQIVIDAKTGQAHQNLDQFKGDLDGVPETKDVQINLRAPNVPNLLAGVQRDIDNGAPVYLTVRARDVNGRPVA